MDVDLTTGIVRILKPGGTTAGTGFVVSDDGLIATCSHVVQDEESQRQGEPRPEYMDLVFHATGGHRRAMVEPEWWRPADAEDVAILRLEGPTPEGVQPLPLGRSIGSKGSPFESFGFPEASSEDGILGSGQILGETTIKGMQVLQLRSPEVTPGFSGAPVWNTTNQHVVGMVTAITNPDDHGRLGETAFATPTEVLREAWPGLPLIPASLPFSPRADFYRHIPLPPSYVPRPELLAGVKSVLLTTTDNLALTSAIKVDALHGMGGIGKTVVARALCDDPEIRATFSDGILWTSLGRGVSEFDLRVKLREWIDTLSGTISEKVPSVDKLKDTLAALLQERACLLIIDDVWKRTDAETFRVGGPHCRLLLTTRNAEVANELGATIQPIPIMTPNEAIRLLEEWAGGSLNQTEADLKARIAKRLGYLPLAIKLAGAQLQHKDPAMWLKTFDARKLKTRRPETIHDSLADTFAVSLENLDDNERHLYISLSIFKEDEATPIVAIARLWDALANLDELECDDTLHDLATRALLQINPAPAVELPDKDHLISGPTVTLHDLLHDFMAAELGDEGRVQNHQILLNAYRQAQASDGWATAPDDGYLYDHLTYHLEQIAHHDSTAATELRGLFADHAWLHARVPQSNYGYEGYIADLMRAWGHAHIQTQRQIEAEQSPTVFADCVRYAIIRTSLNSIAANYVPELVARAVETGLWTPRRALGVIAAGTAETRAKIAAAILGTGKLGYVEQIRAQRLALEDPVFLTRLEIRGSLEDYLVGLAPYLTGELLLQALDLALASEERLKGRCSGALAALALQLGGEQKKQILRQILASALTIEEQWRRANSLAALAPLLTGEQKSQAVHEGLDAALSLVEHELFSVSALEKLAPHLTGELLQRALDTALAISDEGYRARALIALAPQLTSQLLHRKFDSMLAIKNERHRARVLAKLAPQLTGDLLERGLDAALLTENARYRVEALAALTPQLADERKNTLLQLALDDALTIGDEEDRASALTVLVTCLTGEQKDQILQQGLHATLAIESDEKRAKALAALARHLTGELLKRGLDAALTLNDLNRPGALAALAPQLTGKLLQRALDVTLEIGHDLFSVWTLSLLTHQLTGEQQGKVIQRSLDAVLMLNEEYHRMKILTLLAPQLRGESLQRGLDVALAIRNGWCRVEALAALVSQLTGEQKKQTLQQGLDVAQTICDKKERASALTALVPYLTGKHKSRTLQQILDTAEAIEDGWSRAEVLAALAPQLTGELLQRGLDIALALDEWNRPKVSAMLAPRLTGKQKSQILQEGLDAALTRWHDRSRTEVLAALAPQLTGELLQRGLDTALALDELGRPEALAALAPQLTEELFQRGLDAALAVEYGLYRAKGLAAFLPFVPDQTSLLKSIQQAMADYLLTLQDNKREWLFFWFVENDTVFSPPILPTETLSTIANHIIEIYEEWKWL